VTNVRTPPPPGRARLVVTTVAVLAGVLPLALLGLAAAGVYRAGCKVVTLSGRLELWCLRNVSRRLGAHTAWLEGVRGTPPCPER
jgi:hypothetical protein